MSHQVYPVCGPKVKKFLPKAAVLLVDCFPVFIIYLEPALFLTRQYVPFRLSSTVLSPFSTSLPQPEYSKGRDGGEDLGYSFIPLDFH